MRIETIALAIVLFVGLLLAVAVRASTVPACRCASTTSAFMVVGAVPGAILGGRLGYVLDHLDYYSANPAAIADPAQGSLTLTLAVPFGHPDGAVSSLACSAHRSGAGCMRSPCRSCSSWPPAS